MATDFYLKCRHFPHKSNSINTGVSCKQSRNLFAEENSKDYWVWELITNQQPHEIGSTQNDLLPTYLRPMDLSKEKTYFICIKLN